jgi:hypothetical protein
MGHNALYPPDILCNDSQDLTDQTINHEKNSPLRNGTN